MIANKCSIEGCENPPAIVIIIDGYYGPVYCGIHAEERAKA